MEVTEEMYRDELEHDANEIKDNFYTTETSRKRTKRPARKIKDVAIVDGEQNDEDKNGENSICLYTQS